ncbi:MAG: RHS repeat-associated core domain-containing protein [Verrucomicrobiae bacterium]|nr:RHS repeat-associated core domain-containing protein [Verrucomicrobiae bacterium]
MRYSQQDNAQASIRGNALPGVAPFHPLSHGVNTYRMRTGLALQQPTGTWTNGFWYDLPREIALSAAVSRLLHSRRLALKRKASEDYLTGRAKRLTNVTSPAGTFSYLFSGVTHHASRLTLPNTSYITNTYDTVARLTGTWLKHSTNSTINSHQYTYNSGHQRTQQSFSAGSTYDYTYDAIGQLKIADSATASEDRGYTYDAAWNLNYRTNNTTTQTFGVDGKNQLTSEPGMTDAYDANGNLTNRNDGSYYYGYSYTYDDENRLSSASYRSQSGQEANWWRTVFTYDGLGRLRQRQEQTWQYGGWYPGTTTTYHYDGMRVIQERSYWPTVSYTRGSDLSGTLEGAGGIGGLLARSHGHAGSNGNWYAHNYYHADGNGNVAYLVNSSQTLAASFRYDPYGNLISQSGGLASANVYRFSSKEFHAASGLYYYGYRWYAPNLQRWPNRDPLDEAGFELMRRKPSQVFGDGSNSYLFVKNNPISRRDPFGLVSEEDCHKQLTKDMVAVSREGAKCRANAVLGGLIGAFGTVIGGGVGFIISGPPGAIIGGGGVAGVAIISDYWCYRRCMDKVHQMSADAKQRYADCISEVEANR